MPSPAVAEVVDFDRQKAKAILRRFEAAIRKWGTTTVELADAAYEASSEQCWRVDDAFIEGMESGSIGPDPSGNLSRTWLGWKLNRDGRYAERLADYGQLRAILAADPSLPALAEPEGAARPLGRLLRPKLLASETLDVDELHDAIRQVWADAVNLTANGTAAEAVKRVDAALKRSTYMPLKRLLKKSAAQQARDRQAAIVKAQKQMIAGGRNLINLGAVDLFDDAMTELQEIRRR